MADFAVLFIFAPFPSLSLVFGDYLSCELIDEIIGLSDGRIRLRNCRTCEDTIRNYSQKQTGSGRKIPAKTAS
jgi:hypothetical protein